MVANLYNYSTGETSPQKFPLSDEMIVQVMREGEVMVDNCPYIDIPGKVGMSVTEFNEFVKILEENAVSEAKLGILNKCQLLDEIKERVESGNSYNIIDFDKETENWYSSNFTSEYDKGLLLYQLGYRFPVPVPKDLEDYMNYSLLWRDLSINLHIHEVAHEGEHYLVF